ncbi:MAG TPA: SRPBCC family protein [Planctomycetia bacterium]|nr:SRPBCC family protein [Planctomycetia bacterium]
MAESAPTRAERGESRFVYATFIRTTRAKLWQALREPEFTRRYWVETWQDCGWKQGDSWKLMIPDGRIGDQGEVLEIETERRLVLSWRNEFQPGLKSEGFSKLTIELEDAGDAVKLTLVHEAGIPDSKLIEAVSGGWPMILASLKSLLETGESLEQTRRWPSGM